MPATRHIREFMTKSPVVVENNVTMARALQIMEEHKFRHLPVMSNGHLVGVISERELRIVENMRGVDSAMCVVGDFVLGGPFTATPETTLREVVREMAEHKYGSAVIVEGEEVVGMFTTTDALRAMANLLG